MSRLIGLPVLIPLVGAALCILGRPFADGPAGRLGRRSRRDDAASRSPCWSAPTATGRSSPRPAAGRRRSASPSWSTACRAIMLTVGR